MTRPRLSDAEKMRAVPLLIAASALNTVFVIYTFFGTVFVLFLDALGLDKARIGFLVSLVPFCTVLSPFIVNQVSRFSLKRFFLTFYFARKFVLLFLLFTPLALRQGLDAAFWLVAAVIFLFSVLRAVSFTAYHPWSQSLVPAGFRGKFGGLQSTAGTVANLLAIAFAGYLVGLLSGLSPYMIIIGLGVAAGLLSGFFYALAPEEDFPARRESARPPPGETWAPFRDRRFIRFLACLALVSLVIHSINSFVPLFLREQVLLPPDRIILLNLGGALAALLFCYLFGWGADRYGSKPVMMTGLGGMMFLPLAWVLLPLAGDSAWLPALAIAFLKGIFLTGWNISATRYLYVRAVPTSRKVSYFAAYMAVLGFSDGVGPLLSGLFINHLQGYARLAEGRGIVNPYLPFFLVLAACLGFVLVLVSRLGGERGIPARKFIGMFFQGNPMLAFESLLRFGFEREEPERVRRTERIGLARSTLNIADLAESLRDPSFNVRYEAIISAAHMPPEPELVDALLGVLGGPDPDLAGSAAWALGRIGDPVTILPLREMLFSKHPFLRARSARALGMLGDRGCLPMLRHLLEKESEPMVRVACCSALGSLRARDFAPLIVSEIERAKGENQRQELVLALVRMLGGEGVYINLLRRCHQDREITLSQACFRLRGRRRLAGCPVPESRARAMEEAAELFGNGQFARGCACLAGLVRSLPPGEENSPVGLLALVAPCLETAEPRLEYVLIAIHVLGYQRPGSSRARPGESPGFFHR